MSATCRQRSIVAALERLDVPATVDQLVDVLVAPSSEPAGRLERWGDVHEELHVVDLPVLDAIGIVDYDSESGLVALPAADAEQSVASTSEPVTVVQ
ncbi:DUF7344 domain-containing protein [Natrononativus amylolyticus]|uniref:DUF7344 domain-containing protein n=1 Tax=Natrononativus amylolyticus TaxID=2963434 RepID=UPI0020CEC608|nr:hypothetical protein [Natrononativus amylolyticus]